MKSLHCCAWLLLAIIGSHALLKGEGCYIDMEKSILCGLVLSV